MSDMSTVSLVILPIIFIIIVAIGIVGNTLVIVVIVKDQKMRKSSTNLLIINLAVADLVIMTFGIPEIVMFVLNRGWLLGEIACKFNRFVLVSALYSSVISLVVLCAERFIGIVFPLKVNDFCTRKKIICVIRAIWPISALCALPVALYNITMATGPGVEHCRIALPADTREESRRLSTVYRYIEAAVFYFTPILIQVVLYSITAQRLFSSNKQLSTKLGSKYRCEGTRKVKDSASDTIRARRGVVKMLVASVILYFISYSPVQAHLIYSTFARSGFLESWEFFSFTLILTHINSAANPILYGIFSQNFRRHFRRCLSSCVSCGAGGDMQRSGVRNGRYNSISDSRLLSTRSSVSSKMVTGISEV